MLLLNFSHPFHESVVPVVRAHLNEAVEVREVAVDLDLEAALWPQFVRVADAANLSPTQWQTAPLLVHPPGMAPDILMAEIAGRRGFLPLRLVLQRQGAIFVFKEILDLQSCRDQARRERFSV